MKFKILLLIFILFALANTASAHVRYFISDKDFSEKSGLDFSFLFEALKDPQNIMLMIGTVVLLGIVYFLSIKLPFLRHEIATINKRADGYSIFTPWILRLSLGVALIGSGVSETLVSPVLTGFEHLALIQILLGFLILVGFLVIPSVIVALGLYVFAFTQDTYLLGNLEFFAIAFSLLILDNEKPGLDDLLGLPKISPLRLLKRYVPLVLRFGIGGAMIFLGIYEKILNPHISESVVISTGLINAIPVSTSMWVFSAGIIEVLIGLALVAGFYTRLSSAIAFVVLSMSFFYFGEDVSSHITLFGILAVLFITRGGIWSLDCKRNKVNYEFTCE